MGGAHTTRIDLLRHGEAVGGARYRGSRDDPLTARGWEQMWAAVRHGQWDLIVSSPLSRCSAFARALARRRALPLAIDDRLRELEFGAWEGASAAELLATDRDGLTRFWTDPLAHPPPGAEPWQLFCERVRAVWGELSTRHAGAHLLIVSHGGPIRVIAGQLLGLSFRDLLRLELPYAVRTRVRLDVDARGNTRSGVTFHPVRL